MARITVYLDDHLVAQVKTASHLSGVSQSQWIVDAIRLRLRNEWPSAIQALAGAWPDFPAAETIRAQSQARGPRYW